MAQGGVAVLFRIRGSEASADHVERHLKDLEAHGHLDGVLLRRFGDLLAVQGEPDLHHRVGLPVPEPDLVETKRLLIGAGLVTRLPGEGRA